MLLRGAIDPHGFAAVARTVIGHAGGTPRWRSGLVSLTCDRLRLEREGNRVRLITRGGYNWADRYPWIVEAALKNRHKQFVIDGEAVVLGVDGIADFNALRSRRHTNL